MKVWLNHTVWNAKQECTLANVYMTYLSYFVDFSWNSKSYLLGYVFSLKVEIRKTEVLFLLRMVVAAFIFLSEQEEFYKYTRSNLHWQADFK